MEHAGGSISSNPLARETDELLPATFSASSTQYNGEVSIDLQSSAKFPVLYVDPISLPDELGLTSIVSNSITLKRSGPAAMEESESPRKGTRGPSALISPPASVEEPKEKSMRDRVHDFVEGKGFQITMAVLTFFALWGDDFRRVSFYKEHDPVFYWLYGFTFCAFLIELTVSAIVQEEYKWSFFFWLDVVATVSLLLDIPAFMTFIRDIHGLSNEETRTSGGWARTSRTTRVGSKTGRVVRILRLVRLFRSVNLTRCCSRGRKSELDEHINQPMKTQGKQEKRVEASRLGKMLSEQTTRTVLMGVLCLLITQQSILNDESMLINSYTFALENLFWFGLSACTSVEEFQSSAQNNTPLICNEGEHRWVSPEGYDFMIYEFTQASRFGLEGKRTRRLQRPMLGLKISDIKNPQTGVNSAKVYGSAKWLDEVTSTRECLLVDQETEYPFSMGEGFMPEMECEPNTCCWKKHPTCWHRGYDEADNCPWRQEEIVTVMYTPNVCTAGKNCEKFTVVVNYLDRYQFQLTAQFSLLQTTFIVILLGYGAFAFSKDTQILVIAPIEKMVGIVKQLADNPLSKPEVTDEEEEVTEVKKSKKKGGSGGGDQLETSMLENTILKIGGLLQVGFGEAGAQIIGKNMASQDGELNILIPGRKIIGIFGFCDIREFTETTECLLEEVMVFVNKIARIVHVCVHEWNGAANKNIGDCFLVTWIMNDAEEQFHMLNDGYEHSEALGELADKSLIAFLKVIAELRRASDLSAYARHPKIIPKFGMDYRVNMGFGLHVGWAIEGAIGSEHKIDASYLSPHVNMCARLETATRQYGIDLLFSQAMHAIISQKAKERCRKLDVVIVKGSLQPMGIYTFDINEEIPPIPEGHQMGQVIPPAEITCESLKAKGIEWTFVLDQDIIRLQEGITLEFQNTWRQAFHFYINGKWPSARELFIKCSNYLQYGDGPSECLLAYVNQRNCEAPEDWTGCRVLDSK